MRACLPFLFQGNCYITSESPHVKLLRHILMGWLWVCRVTAGDRNKSGSSKTNSVTLTVSRRPWQTHLESAYISSLFCTVWKYSYSSAHWSLIEVLYWKCLYLLFIEMSTQALYARSSFLLFLWQWMEFTTELKFYKCSKAAQPWPTAMEFRSAVFVVWGLIHMPLCLLFKMLF